MLKTSSPSPPFSYTAVLGFLFKILITVPAVRYVACLYRSWNFFCLSLSFFNFKSKLCWLSFAITIPFCGSDLGLFFVELEELRVFFNLFFLSVCSTCFFWLFPLPHSVLNLFSHCSCSARAAYDPWRHLLSTPVLNNLSFLFSCHVPVIWHCFLSFSLFSTPELCYYRHSPFGLLAWLLHAVSAGVGQYSYFLEENWLSAAHIVLYFALRDTYFSRSKIVRRR